MARSKTGGSRAYIRGRVGSDVYSIGKDAKGKKQQVVRSLAESVKNPQTIAQMRGRMIMSTVMQAVSAMRPIIDHSFDNVPAGQPNVSEFIKRNYALIKADVQANPSGSNAFGLVKYQEKGVKMGAYVISAGSAIEVAGLTIDGTNKTITIDLTGDVTIGGLKSKLGINSNDYFTICAIVAGGKFIYERFHIASDLADDVVIAAGNVGDVFTVDGNTTVTLALSGSSIVATLADLSANNAVITSRKQESGFIHSDATLVAPSAPQYTSDVALPTYPVGDERFLNGGSEQGGDSPFVPEPFVATLVSASANGSNWAKNAVVNAANPKSCNVSIVLDSYQSGHRVFFGSQYSASNPSMNRGFFINGVNGSGVIASLAGTDDTPETNEMWLWVDGEKLEKWGSITYSNEVVRYNITTSVDPSGAGTVTGAGQYEDGATCNLVASPASGKVFSGWYNGASLVSSDANYSFTVTGNLLLTAKFEDAPVAGFSNMKLGNNDWTQNESFYNTEANQYKPITGKYTGGQSGLVAVLSDQNVMTGLVLQNISNSSPVGADGTFSHTPNYVDDQTMYMYVGTLSGTSVTVVDKYLHTVKSMDPDS